MRSKANKINTNLRIFGDLERRVMDIVWESYPIKVREIYEKIKLKRKIAYTTIMTIMDRLFVKGILKRVKEGKTYLYSASHNKEDFFEKTSKSIINDLIRDFGEVAIAQFANTLDAVDHKKLKALRDKIKSAK